MNDVLKAVIGHYLLLAARGIQPITNYYAALRLMEELS
jgi:hypothetical protein